MAGHWKSVVEKGSDQVIAPSHWGAVKVLNFRSNDNFMFEFAHKSSQIQFSSINCNKTWEYTNRWLGRTCHYTF